MKLFRHCLPVSLLLVSTAVSATPYSRIIAFGDSLTDAGQYPDVGAPVIDLAGNQAFTSGMRLTNRVGPGYLGNNTEVTAPMAVQIVSEVMGLGRLSPSSPILPGLATGAYPGYNYGLAGSDSSRILASITEPDGASVRVEGLGLETPRDGYLVEFEQADPDALFYVNGGANDIFDLIPPYLASVQGALAGDQPPPGMDLNAVDGAVDNIAAGIRALSDAGARYIMVSNVPDLGHTPLAAGIDAQFTQAAAALAGFVPGQLSAISASFNSRLYASLNATDANVVPLNVSGLLQAVAANPVAYGFDAPMPTATCFDPEGADCGENPVAGIHAENPDPDRLIFNDAVHPTGRAQELIADYMLAILNAPAEISLLAQMGRQVASGELARTGSWLDNRRRVASQQNVEVFVQVEQHQNHLTDRQYDLRRDLESDDIAVGVSWQASADWRVGAVLSDQSAESAADNSLYTLDGTALTLFGSYGNARTYADVLVSMGTQDFDSRRSVAIGMVESEELGSTSGESRSFALEAGYDISDTQSAWQYGPRLGYQYVSSDIDAFVEAGESITALGFGDQTQKTKRAELGVFASYAVGRIGFDLEAGMLRDLEDRAQDLQMWQLALPDTDSYYLPGHAATKSDGFSARLGASYRLTEAAWLTAGYRLVNIDDVQYSANIGLAVRF